ncbi:LysR family transcriptional regulator [Thalassolituus sp. LLYu03]|uniref:LysR family transcriptional regulator n=1 Tax=Thalassolituus sp. LLYu03 TaxID=3421656 RepID=UPI003D26E41E
MSDKTINIRHLRAFLEVARCKSISKATEKVYLSQPAITQAIAKLEMLLDATLFERKSDGMYLTDTGAVFVSRVERAFELIHDGLRDALRFGGSKQGVKSLQLLNLVTTTQLRAMVAMASARSFSEAGRNLGVSQSSLHRSTRELESLLGIELLEKTSTGINPGKAALALARATRLAFSEIDQGRDEIHSLHHQESGHMRIGSMPLARTSVLPKSIIEFSQQYPDFRISVIDGPYSDLLYHLRHANIDFLIGALRFPAPGDDVVQEEFFSSEVVIVARPDHPYMKQTIDMALLERSSWVVPHSGTPTRTIFENFFTEAGFPVPERLVESGSQILIRSLLEGSDRLTVVSAHQVQRELADGTLRILPFPIRHAYRPIGISLRKGWRPTRTQQAFIDILRRHANAIESYRQALSQDA